MGLEKEVAYIVDFFSSLAWTPNEVVGMAFLLFPIFLTSASRLFFDFLTLKWLGKEIAGLGKTEPTKTKVRKFFFPMITRNPNDEFRPYLAYVGPFTISMVIMMSIGFFLMIATSIESLIFGISVVFVTLFVCYKLAKWQVKGNRW